MTPSKRRHGFVKGDPRAIAAGKKGYQVLRLKGLDPYLVKQIEERGYRRGFADGHDKAKTLARPDQPQPGSCAADLRAHQCAGSDQKSGQ